MQTRSIFRFALLCAFMAASAGPTAQTAFAQKDQRDRDRVSKEDRNRQAQSKKETRGESSAPNKSRGRDEGGNARKSGGR